MSSNELFGALKYNFAIQCLLAEYQSHTQNGENNVVEYALMHIEEMDCEYKANHISAEDLLMARKGVFTQNMIDLMCIGVETNRISIEDYSDRYIVDADDDEDYSYDCGLDDEQLKDAVSSEISASQDFANTVWNDNTELFEHVFLITFLDDVDASTVGSPIQYKTNEVNHELTYLHHGTPFSVMFEKCQTFDNNLTNLKVSCCGVTEYSNIDLGKSNFNKDLDAVYSLIRIVEASNVCGTVHLSTSPINSLNYSPVTMLSAAIVDGIFDRYLETVLKDHQQHGSSVFCNESDFNSYLGLGKRENSLFNQLGKFLSQHTETAEQFIFDLASNTKTIGQAVAQSYVDHFLANEQILAFPSYELVVLAERVAEVLNNSSSRTDEHYLSCKLQLSLSRDHFEFAPLLIEQRTMEFAP
ncbi:hypothetical protein OCF84_21650 (plasmid) [Shewanella xiamenensis]|uniref:Uncharacterized protein n=1 Tax=Shewanella xiamenensis TaxID=332186 RepID=A0ABT6UDQ5_9GAMM|nr:hypothetical protein [Shewanella xiamenensis]MDI5832516.1 hypothetical protein [Shewanella xiamenensis]WHF57865.1 hypothetical protein OCF84_21650 [Shewanella xiamenensis]